MDCRRNCPHFTGDGILTSLTVLSLFDGISCGQIALARAGISVKQYFASEIDKHAIKVTQSRHPDTIQLGDILELDVSKLPEIDLLIGGSPCQSFSVAGDGTGFDGKSKLFWEFVRILKELKPKYFLLENVKMKSSWRDIITETVGVEPIEINSALVSGQHRRRYYWTNIPGNTQPKDQEISLSDVLEVISDNEDVTYGDRLAPNGKTVRVEATDFPYTFYEARTDEGKAERRRLRKLLGRDTTPRGAKYKIYLPLRHLKSNCIVATPSQLDWVVDNEGRYRKLTVTELERLQTLPIGYTEGISPTQRRKAIGNGWTVDVIAHIFLGIK
jgi:site-specific DNA-cytosine methylase